MYYKSVITLIIFLPFYFYLYISSNKIHKFGISFTQYYNTLNHINFNIVFYNFNKAKAFQNKFGP